MVPCNHERETCDGKREHSARCNEHANRALPCSVGELHFTTLAQPPLPLSHGEGSSEHASFCPADLAAGRRRSRRLRAALLDPPAAPAEGAQPVGMSFAMVGNAPPLVSATLSRSDDPRLPRTVVVVTAGSVCLTTVLSPDAPEEDRMPLSKIRLSWTTHLRSDKGTGGLSIRYSSPVYFDWSGTNTILQPIEHVTLEVDRSTRSASFTPIFRDSALIL